MLKVTQLQPGLDPESPHPRHSSPTATPEQVGARVPPCFPRMRAGTHGAQAWVLYTPTPTHREALEPKGAIQAQHGYRACRGGQPQLPSLL